MIRSREAGGHLVDQRLWLIRSPCSQLVELPSTTSTVIHVCPALWEYTTLTTEERESNRRAPPIRPFTNQIR
ncbi:hypothetical protein EYF80_035654 [Liparis tanakae]|uniref:Uncharacterized protein n=1 Tax=Liparis tanakae TaxID=230148 RepID=A0A4Z2GKZ3_9TELE|nr:hypothetical protein EYF80_035654 [Liparis tanakae]